tara:strand:+ start:110 stop:1189 length:1080 start_codon:yes stop_codon:yes gene_type:complete
MSQYRNINVRSPFYTQYSSAEQFVDLELRVWIGDFTTDKPAAADYTMTKEVDNGAATFEIAELIRDIFTQDSSLSSGFAWVEVKMSDTGDAADEYTQYLASEGYRVYTQDLQHDGESFESDFVALPVYDQFGNSRVFVTENKSTVVPIYVQPQNATDWEYQTYDLSGNGNGWVQLPQTTDSSGQFKHIVVNKNHSKIEFSFDGDNTIVYIDVLDCNKYNKDGAVILQYVNKYGAKTRMPFSLKYIESIAAKSDSFQRNLTSYNGLTSGNNMHSNRKRILSAKQTFTINTDWMPEYYVAQIEELLLSEYVWALLPTVDGNNYQPVNITTSNIAKKNHLNDKLIQFTLDLEVAVDYINSLR